MAARNKGRGLFQEVKPVMDRILNRIVQKCGELSTENTEAQRAAFCWLRYCGPFRTVVNELARDGFTFFQVARMLSDGACGRGNDVALTRLERALMREEESFEKPGAPAELNGLG